MTRRHDHEARRAVVRDADRDADRDERPVLVTGGAGFVGANVADRLLRDGRRVVLLDNLSRDGVDRNVAWLRAMHGERVRLEIADIRNRAAVAAAVRAAAQVFHFAAQVAVTTSLDDPVVDFDVNAGGTLNVLEAIRACPVPPPLVFTSTNKVYGGLEDVAMRRDGERYGPADAAIAGAGIGEARPLDFHSPYGCSKGTADQYVRDYARSYGLPTVVFRMSCIYGPHQFGTEDQGWVAHFLIRALDGEPIVLYGDGCQVRDVLFVEDLVDAFLLAQRHMHRLQGSAFNIGGGPRNTTSLLELVERIGTLTGRRPEVEFREWRTGDQRWYVSDTRAFATATGWRATVGVEEGVARLLAWLQASRAEPAAVRRARASRRAPERAVPLATPVSDGGVEITSEVA